MPTLVTCLCTCLLLAGGALHAAETPSKADVAELQGLAQAWLLQQQEDDGSFLPGERFKLGITTVAALALLDAGNTGDDPAVAAAAAFIKQFVQPDGGIYNPEEGLSTYTTSLGLRVLLRAGMADEALKKGAQNYLLGLQNTEEGSITEGGIGYGQRGAGNEDLSNTAMAVEALAESGVPADDPAMQRALKFIERCQNLSSTNDMPWAGNDGGAVYSPDSSMALGSFRDGNEGAEKPAEGEQGGATELTSYGSMTYALITSYIHLDLKPGDPRLDAALAWVKSNYQFAANPGMPEAQSREGLFYYYQAMAKTFDLLDAGVIELPDGSTTDWRADLFNAIQERATIIKGDNGKPALALWINDMPRWAEGIPHLTTSYMLTALSRIHASLEE